MEKIFKFEIFLKTIIDFSNNGEDEYNEIRSFQNKIFEYAGRTMIKKDIDTIYAIGDLFKKPKYLEALKKLFLKYEQVPICFDYSQIERDIKDYAKCKGVINCSVSIRNFEELKEVIKAEYNNHTRSFLKNDDKLEILVRSILSVIKENEERLKKVMELPTEEKETLEKYVLAFENHELISEELMNKVIAIIEKNGLISFRVLLSVTNNSSLDDIFRKYTEAHNHIITIDAYGDNALLKPNYKEHIEWDDSMNMEEFVDVYFDRILTGDERLLRYLLPQDYFPRYQEFLNSLLKKFGEQLSSKPSIYGKYKMLEMIKEGYSI